MFAVAFSANEDTDDHVAVPSEKVAALADAMP
jgi:hypothetical protein